MSIVICSASSLPASSIAATVYVPFAVLSVAVMSNVHTALSSVTVASFASSSARSVFAIGEPSFFHTTFFTLLAVVMFAVTVTFVLLLFHV